MSTRAGKRPDTCAILASLKGFQRDTVEYAFTRLYQAEDASRRFLVADEVGLGKTLVARGLIAKAIDHLWEGDNKVEQIDIVYICSNAQVARQNVRRLKIGDGRFVRAGRLGLLPQEIHDLKVNRVNFLALTPGTSFDLRSSMGIEQERVVLYHLLQHVWPNKKTGPMNLLQGYVKRTGHFRWKLKEFKRSQRLDVDLANAFKQRLLQAEALHEQYEDLCKRFCKTQTWIPWNDRKDQIRFIGKLRAMLAEVCVTALEPDLVILDEFQRFKRLLDGEDATSRLARHLFNYSDETSHVRLLLLSATPYRMYTLHHESSEDDHYRDFLRTVEFLDPELKKSGGLRRQLDDYRQAMYRVEFGTEPLIRIKQQIENQLRRVMSRTERLRISEGSDGMLREVPCTGLELTAADVQDFLALNEIGRKVKQPNVLDYWKSAPYLLSFMDDYKLKTRVKARLNSSSGTDLGELLTGGCRVSLSWEQVEAYKKLDPANARLRSLLFWMEDSEAWRLLWLPPALPYYTESGAWKTAREQQFTKRLIFSTWQVVPKAVASVMSYDVERRIFPRLNREIRNTPEDRRKRRPLLRFASAEDRLTGMPVLAIMYPSPSLAALGDPISLPESAAAMAELGDQIALPERTATLADAVARAHQQIEHRLALLTEPYPSDGPEDESWYWAAPILLDLEDFHTSTRDWFCRNHLASQWNEKENPKAGSRWAAHVEEAKKLACTQVNAEGSLELGRPPADLAEVLAVRSVAGPATCALRALTRASGPATREKTAARDAAARIAWNFRSLFNLPEATALIRGERPGDKTPYWRQVLDYCAAGNLQAVLDEYIHVLRDLEGLFASDDEKAWDRLAKAMSAVLSLRTGAPRVDEFSRTDDGVRIKHHRMRNHFAMRFGVQETDDGRAGAREGQVRRAFNSPFWPFVLASTSVGQEGLDFHAYCHAVMHWNLPSNPVDLEQREGRVHRYKGHAVRKNVAAQHAARVLDSGDQDIWDALFEVARQETSDKGGLVPYWLFPQADGAYIERHVPALPLSWDASRLVALKRSLAVYRMVFGQPRQDDLVAFLLERCSREKLEEIEPLLSIDLSPRTAHTPPE